MHNNNIIVIISHVLHSRAGFNQQFRSLFILMFSIMMDYDGKISFHFDFILLISNHIVHYYFSFNYSFQLVVDYLSLLLSYYIQCFWTIHCYSMDV
jgi:hypothetical protein